MMRGRENALPKIAVIGGGAWGTALAAVLAAKQAKQPIATHNADGDKNYCSVTLYCRDPQQAEAMQSTRGNEAFLPGIPLPEALTVTADMQAALHQAEYILAVVPSQALRLVLTAAKAYIAPSAPLVLCCKGIERTGGKFMTEAARDVLPHNPLAVLSGPSFAVDVARGLPAAVTIAAENLPMAKDLANLFSASALRCYASEDIKGVELGGALKNVLALGAGMAAGCGLGLSAQAAFITRGFAELRRLCLAVGGKEETMTGLAVLGDLILTCSSPQSRNYSYGFAFARGGDMCERPLAEGVATAPAAAALCCKYGVEAPLITMTAAVLAGELNIEQAIRELLARPLKIED